MSEQDQTSKVLELAQTIIGASVQFVPAGLETGQAVLAAIDTFTALANRIKAGDMPTAQEVEAAYTQSLSLSSEAKDAIAEARERHGHDGAQT